MTGYVRIGTQKKGIISFFIFDFSLNREKFVILEYHSRFRPDEFFSTLIYISLNNHMLAGISQSILFKEETEQ